MNAPSRTLLIAVASGLTGVLVGTLVISPALENRGEGLSSGTKPPVTFVLGDDVGKKSGAVTELPITDPRISFRQLEAIAGRLAADDPEAAVKMAREIPGHDNREAYLGEVLRTWGEKDGKAAAAFVSTYFQGEQLTDALYYIADGWAEADPEATATWFTENTEGSVLDDAMWEALEAWGRKDPRAAFAWSDQVDSYVKSTAMQGLAEGWGAVDPEGAAAAGMEMRDKDYGQEFLVSVMTQWAGSDPQKAGQWAAGLVDERLRARVTVELAQMWSESDPVSASKWASGLGDPGSRRAAEMGIAIGWSEHDPGGAVEWALSAIRDPKQLEEMVGDITFNWSNIDPRGATEWLEKQGPGEKTDYVLKSFSVMVADDSPEAAVAWANRISDPTVRDQHVRTLLDGLVGAYGNAAKKAIQGYDLPPELKKEYAPGPE